MSLASRKGSGGEREFCDWIFKHLKLTEKPTRNLNQWRSGGEDIDFAPFVFEIKRCESVTPVGMRRWWLQVTKAARNKEERIPVVCYRQNRKNWNFLVPFKYVHMAGNHPGYAHLEEREFLIWFKNVFESYCNS
jgi:hypothetical protein